MKFHLTDDGPKVCRASKRACLYGDHFDNEKAALEAFHNNNSVITAPLSKRRLEPQEMPLSAETELLLGKISERGYQPLLVGGCVRDFVLGKESKDIDIEVYGANDDGNTLSYDDIKNVFAHDKRFKINETGESFSVLKVKVGREDFDIALPRTEKSVGDKHTDYDIDHDSTMSFEEASSRRDFTINAIGYDTTLKKFIDPHGGKKDLEQKVLRHIGPAFADDPLRCLRGVNFAARFNLTMSPETLKICQNLSPQYSTIAHERVEEEFNKLFYKGSYCEKGFAILYDTGWSKQIPSLKNVSREDFQKLGKILNHTPKSLRKSVANHFLISLQYPDSKKFFSSSTQEQRVSKNFSDLGFSLQNGSSWGKVVETHRTFKKFNPEISNQSLLKSYKLLGIECSDVFKKLPETPVPTAVSGDWLIKNKGMKPGVELGKLIKKAQQFQDESGETDPEIIFQKVWKK